MLGDTVPQKTLLEDIMRYAAINPDLRSPTSRFYDPQMGRTVEEAPHQAEAAKVFPSLPEVSLKS